MKLRFIVWLLVIDFLSLASVSGQQLPSSEPGKMLLANIKVQLEVTEGIDDMYNFNFDRAESQFGWLRQNYPEHPLPYFLIGLNHWWKIIPNTQNNAYDELFLTYMDSAIFFAEKMFDEDPSNVEAAFFLSGAYSFKGRLYSERTDWTKAAFAGKKALKYLDYCRGNEDLSPELLFGDGLYNYFSIWIRENYSMLKPIMWFFPKGDKSLGIEQLTDVSQNAFYTRIEAMIWLVKIHKNEGRPDKALQIATYLHEQYPNNAYFHRYYARMLYENGQYVQMQKPAEQILQRIEEGWPGYEEISGRYAAFFLGSYYKHFLRDYDKATNYFEKAVAFSEAIDAEEAGYYLHALTHLADIAKEAKEYDRAMAYYDKVLEHAARKHTTHQAAKDFKKDYKKGRLP